MASTVSEGSSQLDDASQSQTQPIVSNDLRACSNIPFAECISKSHLIGVLHRAAEAVQNEHDRATNVAVVKDDKQESCQTLKPTVARVTTSGARNRREKYSEYCKRIKLEEQASERRRIVRRQLMLAEQKIRSNAKNTPPPKKRGKENSQQKAKRNRQRCTVKGRSTNTSQAAVGVKDGDLSAVRKSIQTPGARRKSRVNKRTPDMVAKSRTTKHMSKRVSGVQRKREGSERPAAQGTPQKHVSVITVVTPPQSGKKLTKCSPVDLTRPVQLRGVFKEHFEQQCQDRQEVEATRKRAEIAEKGVKDLRLQLIAEQRINRQRHEMNARLKSSISVLTSRVRDQQSSREEAEHALKRCQTELRTREIDNKKLLDKLSASESARMLVEKEVEDLRTKLDQANLEIVELEKICDNREETLERTKKNLERAQETCKKANIVKRQKENMIGILVKEKGRLHDKVNTLSVQLKLATCR